MKKPIALPAVLIAALALAACSADDGTDAASAEARIAFAPAEVSSSAATRGAQATASTITSYSVSCSVYGSDESYTGAAIGSYFYNITPASDGTTDYYWPTDQYKVSFFAYSPANNSSITPSSDDTKGRPTYTYTVPKDISEQVDFMTAEVLDQSKAEAKKPVTLPFKHCCADVRMSVHIEGTSAIISSISVYGVKYKGTYNDDDGWTLTDDENSDTDHTFIVTPADRTVAANATVDMTGTDNHLILLPQTIAKGTSFISVEATIAGVQKSLTYTLPSDFPLEAGKSYNLKITLTPDYIIVDTSSDITDWEMEPVYINSGNVIGVADWQSNSN